MRIVTKVHVTFPIRHETMRVVSKFSSTWLCKCQSTVKAFLDFRRLSDGCRVHFVWLIWLSMTISLNIFLFMAKGENRIMLNKLSSTSRSRKMEKTLPFRSEQKPASRLKAFCRFPGKMSFKSLAYTRNDKMNLKHSSSLGNLWEFSPFRHSFYNVMWYYQSIFFLTSLRLLLLSSLFTLLKQHHGGKREKIYMNWTFTRLKWLDVDGRKSLTKFYASNFKITIRSTTDKNFFNYIQTPIPET